MRREIKRLLLIGLTGALLTAVGDFLLAYGENQEFTGITGVLMANAPNLKDWQLIAGALLGMVGIFLEGIGFFAVYKLIKKRNYRYARIYRLAILAYIWLAPVGCHMNVGLFNMAFKYLLNAGYTDAVTVSNEMLWWFGVPLYILLFIFWIPMLVIQFVSFAKGLTVYPKKAKWFNLVTVFIPVLVIGFVISKIFGEVLASTFESMVLSFGNLWTFWGLLITLPDEDKFEEFENA